MLDKIRHGAVLIYTHLVQVPNLEHCLAIVERVHEEAVPGREGVVLAPQDRAVRQHQPPEQLEVVLPDLVAYVDRSARDGAGSGVEQSARVRGLEHVPVRVDEVAHPQAVVRAMHHVTPLEPKRAVRVARWIGAPEIIAYIEHQKQWNEAMVIGTQED